jgi:heme A synthase
MSLIHLIVVLVVVGLILWMINRYIPMEARIKSILNVVVIICVILWLLGVFGILPAMSGIRIGR